ncbi:MAG: hypothetical protein J5726_03150 [Treponema sp.]|nr:hypothetical protein [Treponema sp.]
MKNQCDSKDYDFYSFVFPLKAFPKAKRNKYIYSQLEKMHPCFSDSCCFDYKFRLEKKEVRADVIVMQKYTLAEYKNKSKRIIIPERKGKVFFSGIKPLKVVTAAVLTAAVVLFVVSIFLSRQTEESIDNAIPQISEETDNLYEVEESNAVILMENVLHLGGASDFFSWESDGFTEKTTLALRNVFPEQIQSLLPQAVFSSVQYDAGGKDLIPYMTVQLNQRVKNGFSQTDGIASEQRASLRAFLMSQEEGVLIMEETVKPDALKFSLRGNLKNKTEKVLAVLDEKQIYVSSLVIKKQADEVVFEIIFSDLELTNQDKLIQTLMNSVSIFFEELVQQEPAKPQIQALEVQQEKLTLVGKILHEDGRVTEYYKNELGRIIKKER